MMPLSAIEASELATLGVDPRVLVEDLGAVLVLEEEVLELGADVEGVEAHALGPLEGAAKDVAGIALVRLTAGSDDVAEHPRDGYGSIALT